MKSLDKYLTTHAGRGKWIVTSTCPASSGLGGSADSSSPTWRTVSATAAAVRFGMFG